MHALPRPRVVIAVSAISVFGCADALAQPLVRETATTLVLPIPGAGGGPGTGAGQGGAGTVLPATLSQTGAFTDVARLTPARGLVYYEPNAVLWSDYAKKKRWVALTGAGTTFEFQRDGGWGLPTGAVWIKQFDLEMRRGDPTSLRHVETRFLVKEAHGGVTGYTYRWNDAQTDAALVPQQGAEQVFTIVENGVTRQQTWIFPGRFDCQTCHNAAAGQALSFNTRQLNRAAPESGVNQIAALAQAGYLNVPSVPELADLPRLSDSADATFPLETRVRSYLDINCAICHRPGVADTGSFDARASTPLSLAGLVNGAVTSRGSDSAHRIIAPGAASSSEVLTRVSTRGTLRMPPLATNERDASGETLLREWINALALPQPPSRWLNVSALATAASGGPAITGFVVAPGAPRAILVRAVGPTLGRLGVNGALASPALTLFDANLRAIGTNTRWNTSPNAPDIRTATTRAGAFPLAEGSADSVLLLTLSPGAYTAHAAPADNATGAALVEIYDADPSLGSTALINASVRASVGPSAPAVIPGLVIGAGAAKTVLIRAVGPGLSAFGVPGSLLSAPVVSLWAGNEAFLTNARWNSAANAADIRAAAQRVGAFALTEGGADSAILASLSPGAYTIRVSGAGSAAGNVLVELYELP